MRVAREFQDAVDVVHDVARPCFARLQVFGDLARSGASSITRALQESVDLPLASFDLLEKSLHLVMRVFRPS